MVQKNKDQQLGMPFGTANGKLKKSLLFSLIQKYKEDDCYRCGGKIESVNEMSIEHKKSWYNVNPELFWDLENVTFAHLKCNIAAKMRKKSSHGTNNRYKKWGCRCLECTCAHRDAMRIYRKEKS